VTLQLEHKNGNHIDNRIENLELLCALCHSQTSTHGGKNTRHARAKRAWIEDVIASPPAPAPAPASPPASAVL
jgi:hypothetical protein